MSARLDYPPGMTDLPGVVCPSCGSANRPDRKFCAACGTALAVRCEACGTANLPGERFCGECGAALGGAAGSPPAARAGLAAVPLAAAAVPETPAGVAERRLVTVLFADLVAFTTLSETLDVEAVRELQTAYFDAARSVIERYGGTVEKFIGDAVMAIWGAPVAREDDAERAVRAGLDLVDAVAALGERSGQPSLRARAGILTGETAVTFGAAGQGLVTGDVVNTAARLQAAADPGTVLVGETTVLASQAAITYAAVGDLSLKGKALPVAAWRAVQVVAGRGGSGRSDAIEAPFVGRTAELRALKEALQAVGQERRARFVGVVGQAGIGKSRLAWELEKHVDGLIEAVYWHRGRSPAYGEGVAYWALGEMIRERARIAESDAPPETASKLAAMLAEYVPDSDDRRWIEPHLRVLLGLEPSAGADRTEQFAAWRRVFEAIARRGTTVLVFEDLQWADDGLLDFVDSLFEWSRSSPILIVALTRPELLDRRPTLGSASRNALRLHLEPLGPAESRELLDGLVPGLPDETAALVVERAEGIPLYLIELVRMLRSEDGTIAAPEAGRIAIPPSLQALVGARLDALAGDERSLLQDAAVLGQTFTVAGLAAVSGREADDVAAALRSLVRREYLVLDADPRSPERGQFGFVQSVVREVAYGTLARRDRRTRHLAAARYFEALADDEAAPVLATHYLEAYRASPDDAQGAAIRAQARLAIRASADRAARLHNDLQAIRDLDIALELADDDAERAAILERQAGLAEAAAEFARAIDVAGRARALYEATGDGAGATRVIAALGGIELKSGRHAEATALLEDAVTRLDPATDPEAYARVAALIARSLMLSGHGIETVEWAERALAAAGPIRLIETVAEALNTRGVGLDHLNRLDEGMALIRASIELAATHRLSNAELRARYNLAGRLFGDDPAEAVEILRAAREVAIRTGRRDWQLLVADFLGGMLIPVGRWDEALRVHEPTPIDELPPESRITSWMNRAYVEAARGDRTAWPRAKALVDGLGQERELGPQQTSARTLDEIEIAMLEERLEDTEPMFGRVVASNYQMRAISLRAAIALRRRDAAAARAALAEDEYRLDTSRIAQADRRFAQAGVDALEGRRDDAVAGFVEAARWFRDHELPVILGGILVDAVALLGPDDPESPAFAAEARSIFEPLGARTILDRLDRIEAGARGAAAAPARPSQVASAPTEARS